MTLEYVVASAHKLERLRRLSQATSLRSKWEAKERRAKVWRDLAAGLAVLAAGWLVGAVASW